MMPLCSRGGIEELEVGAMKDLSRDHKLYEVRLSKSSITYIITTPCLSLLRSLRSGMFKRLKKEFIQLNFSKQPGFCKCKNVKYAQINSVCKMPSFDIMLCTKDK